MKTIKPNFVTDSTGYISRYATGCLKGFFALLVLIHHLYQYTGIFKGTVIATILQALGYLSVSMFFYMSGYGLVASYEKKSQDYIKNFFRNRILPFFIIYTLLTLIYSVFRILMGENISWLRFFKSYSLGSTLVVNGWYLQVILLFYLLFWLTYSFVKNAKHGLISMTCLAFLYCFICVFSFDGTTIYESTLAFILGMYWFEYKDTFKRIIEKKKLTSLVTAFVLFSLSFLVSLISHNSNVVIVSKMISSVLFVCFFMCICMNLGSALSGLLCNKFMEQLGKISLEIYVTQGIFLRLFHSDIININSPIIYIILVSVFTILLSIALRPIFSYTYKVCSVHSSR